MSAIAGTPDRPLKASRSQTALMLARLLHDPGFVVGGMLCLIVIAVALFGPSISPYDPLEVHAPQAFQPPNAAHWMGTDNFGRDILSRILCGGRLSLGVGLLATILAAVIGTILGLIAGYIGGWVDSFISWLVDVLMAFPGLLLALAIVAMLGRGLTNLLIAAAISSVPGLIRLVRGSTIAEKERLYVDAARCIGAPTSRIILKHVLPNIVSLVIVWSSMGLAGMILVTAGLGYLGLGAQPPAPEWGVMVSDGRRFLSEAWWMSGSAGLAILVSVLGVNLIGDAAHDVTDPRLRGR